MRNKEDGKIKNTKAISETKKSCITWKTYEKQIYKVQYHIYYVWGWGQDQQRAKGDDVGKENMK